MTVVTDTGELAVTETDAAKTGSAIRAPYRVGQLQDWGMGVQAIQDQFDATVLAFEDAVNAGVLDRPVEIITRAREGLPFQSFQRIRTAYRELVDEGCLVVLGPHTSEQLAAMVEDPQRARVPTITMAVTTEWRGEFNFTLQNGSFGDEAALMVDHLVSKGASRVGVIHEENLIGEDYWYYIKRHARDRGLRIARDVSVGMFFGRDDAAALVDDLRAESIDAMVYVGNGFTARYMLAAAQVARRDGWRPILVTGSIFMAATPGVGYGVNIDDYEGWTGIDQYHEGNQSFTAMLDRFERRFGRRPAHCFAALGYDLGAVTAQAIADARPVCPERVQQAIERIRGMAATLGGPGTMISFAPYSHRGYNGEYILLRTIEAGENRLVAR